MDYQIQQKNVNELYYPEDGNLSKKIQMVISPASLKLKIFYKRKKNAMTVFANLSMRRLKTNIRPSLTWQKLGWIFLAAGSQVEWLHTGDTGGVRLESEYQSGKEKHGSHWQLNRTLNRTSDSAKYL